MQEYSCVATNTVCICSAFKTLKYIPKNNVIFILCPFYSDYSHETLFSIVCTSRHTDCLSISVLVIDYRIILMLCMMLVRTHVLIDIP